MKTNIHERLRHARKFLGLSQEYVATQLELHRTAITAIELGQRSVSTEELMRFSELYGLSLEELAYGKDEDSEVKVFTRRYSELSEDDKKEIQNLVEFKLNLRRMRNEIAK